MHSFIRVISPIIVFLAMLMVQCIVAVNFGYGGAVAAIRLCLNDSETDAKLMSAIPSSINRIYVPGNLKQVVTADIDCDGIEELVGVTQSDEIYYSDDFITWNPLPGKFGQISADYLNDDCFEDLAAVNDSGDVYYTLDLISWHRIPGRL